MFQNNNGKVVKYLAKKSLHADRFRSRITIMTIAVSVCLILSVTLIMSGTEEKHKKTQEGKAQITMAIADENQLVKLKGQPDVEWAGVYAVLGFSYQKDITLNILYEDKVQLKNQERISFTGDFPMAQDEIMLSKNYINYLHKNIKPGDTVSLDLTGMGKYKTYHITGIIDFKSRTNSYFVWVSEKCAQSLMGGNLIPRIAYTRIRTNSIDMAELMSLGKNIAEKCGASAESVQAISDYYGVMNGGDTEGMLPTVLPIGLVVLIFSGIVIYSIFYSSAAKNVRSYGQLRTIGMTKKQVKKMMRREGQKLMLYGIPMGIILGILIGYFAVPGGFSIKNAFIYSAAVSIFTVLMIRISMHVPVKTASNTSPLEGTLYIPYKVRHRECIRKIHSRLTPFHIAFMNLGRNKKKTIITSIMLALSGILLITAAMIAQSLNAEKMARFYMFPHGDIQLTIQEVSKSTFAKNNEEYRSSHLQKRDNPLNSKLVKEIESIDGVKSVTSENGVRLQISYSNKHTGMIYSSSDIIPALAQEQCVRIAPSIVYGTSDYEALNKQNGILIRNGLGNMAVGEKVQINGLGKDGNEFTKELPIVGIYDGNKKQTLCPFSTGADFMMTDTSIAELTGITNQVGLIEAALDPAKRQQATEKIKAVTDANDKVDMFTLEESVKTRKSIFESKTRPLYMIALIVFLFGIINLINTTITQLSSRKLEFGLLQAEGMTSRQVNQMLQTENLFYTGGTAILSLAGGSIFGGILCSVIENTYHSIIYHFPLLIALIFLASMLIIQILLSAYAAGSLKKLSVVERLRMPE